MNLSERIKDFYENRTRYYLNRRTITIIRLDGKGFSNFTSNLNKPFDADFSNDMDATAIYLCEKIQGIKFAYTQSDEISLVLSDFDELETDAWFDYNVQKMVSVAASFATAKFNQLRLSHVQTDIFANEINEHPKLAFFDARVFQVPNVDEMVNAIIQRQQDATRNSVSMAASSVYSHKILEGKSNCEKQDLLMEKGINWNDYLVKYKRGVVISRELVNIESPNAPNGVVGRHKWVPNYNTPIFTQDKEFLYKLIPNIR